MTLIVAIHLHEHILIAADKRSIHISSDFTSLKTDDNSHKIIRWPTGAICGCGESSLINNIAQQLIQRHEPMLDIIQIVSNAAQQRLADGIPFEFLCRTNIYISNFDGTRMQFLEVDLSSGKPELNYLQANEIKVQIVNPSNKLLQSVKHLHSNLKECRLFESPSRFVDYYLDQLTPIFFEQSSIDPTITSHYDIYIQSCITGEFVLMGYSNSNVIDDLSHDGLMPVTILSKEKQYLMIRQILTSQFETLESLIG
jgi:hypothetical protein